MGAVGAVLFLALVGAATSRRHWLTYRDLGEAAAATVADEDADLLAPLRQRGIYLVVDTARNRLYVKRDETILLEAVCSTGSKIETRCVVRAPEALAAAGGGAASPRKNWSTTR